MSSFDESFERAIAIASTKREKGMISDRLRKNIRDTAAMHVGKVTRTHTDRTRPTFEKLNSVTA